MSTNNKKRKYSNSYLQFGFTSIITMASKFLSVFFVKKALGNESMKPSLLTRHLEKVIKILKIKMLNFSNVKKLHSRNSGWIQVVVFFKKTNAVVKASYEVSLMIAKQKKHILLEKT